MKEKPQRANPKNSVRAKPKSTRKPPAKKLARPKPVKVARTDVFVSYSHRDKEWLARLQVHLKPLERDHHVTIWADTKLRGGDRWRTEIDNALARAKAAILLVSADFLASDFIANNELPPLLEAAEREGVLILSVIVGHSGGFAISPLSQFQTINEPRSPLNTLAPGQADEVFSNLFGRVHQAFQPTPAPAARPTVGNPTGTPAPKPSRAGRRLVEPPAPEKATPSPGAKPKKQPVARQQKTLLVRADGRWELFSVRQSQVGPQLHLTVEATTPQQRVFLTTLRQPDQLVGVVMGFQTYLCKRADVESRTEGIKETWHLRGELRPLNRPSGFTVHGVTPDAQAEAQARLLLLNQPLPQTPFGYSMMGNSALPGASPLPTLYHQLNRRAASLMEAAPLVATWFLQTANLVEHILKLTFSLKGSQLAVQFEGERSSAYANESPKLLSVVGTCELAVGGREEELRLSV